MAVDRTPVLKKCRSLDLDPVYLGIDKKSNRQSKRANRKMSEYATQLREKQKAKFSYGITDAYTKTEVDNAIGGKADKATTLEGYGITDAYTIAGTNEAITNAKNEITTDYTNAIATAKSDITTKYTVTAHH